MERREEQRGKERGRHPLKLPQKFLPRLDGVASFPHRLPSYHHLQHNGGKNIRPSSLFLLPMSREPLNILTNIPEGKLASQHQCGCHDTVCKHGLPPCVDTLDIRKTRLPDTTTRAPPPPPPPPFFLQWTYFQHSVTQFYLLPFVFRYFGYSDRMGHS